ncbi:peptide ABC transporter substrate-binding protein [Pseudomonas sp. AU11447]|uniref:FecR domain-containing protein n=1 Tax=unclassified Pseudomonas TaxID=196821 RepID=UPI0006D3DF85|nr:MULTISPECIES: FecR family protein [unclassified Pseudomonas]OBY91518.1 peptide ABC transporter substrate-binding protein [Pseudomonas sp. AU11447]
MNGATPDPRVVKQAIQWTLRLNGNADAELRNACEHWRQANPEHETAWLRVQALNSELAAGYQAVPGARVALETLESSTQRLQRRQALKLLSTFAVGASALWLAREVTPWQRWMADFSTTVGERQRFTLADGSVLQLNTDSAVNVCFDTNQRLLLLERGEILLSTAKDASRPLRVSNRDGLFEALGTRFVLRQDERTTRLSVEEGSVAIAPRVRGQTTAIAEPGQTFEINGDSALLAERSNMDSAAWADGLIVTRDMRLADFLAEIGRYRHGHLHCDASVADLRLSGVFRLDDTNQLLALLPQTLPVRVEKRTDWWVTVSARS